MTKVVTYTSLKDLQNLISQGVIAHVRAITGTFYKRTALQNTISVSELYKQLV